MQKVLITGSGGLLGTRLVSVLGGQYRLWQHFHRPPNDGLSTWRLAGDLTEEKQVADLAERIDPQVIVNSAALADVDRCETNPEESRKINVGAVDLLIRYFPRAKFVQISTDYVFSGMGDRPPLPGDPTAPINTYGRDKLAAEEVVALASPENLIIRVNSVYDHIGRFNMFRYVYENLVKRQAVKALTDQYANPIAALSCARIIADLVAAGASGIYHVGGGDYLTRYDYALRLSRFFEFAPELVFPVTSDTYHRAALRPRRAGLDCRHTEDRINTAMPGLDDDFCHIQEEMASGCN